MVMKRHAEDLIWAKNYDEGKSALKFIKLVTENRGDARELYKGTLFMLNLLLFNRGHAALQNCFNRRH